MVPIATLAVSGPPASGLVENVTIMLVGVDVVTRPTAPLSSVTMFSASVSENPKPLMVTVVAFASRLAVELVMTGVTVAT